MDAAVRGLIPRRGSGASGGYPPCSRLLVPDLAGDRATGREPPHVVEVARRLPSSRKGNLDAMPHDPLEDVRQVRRELAAAIRVAADCRARVLEERPEDDRNRRSSAALYDAAAYVGQLPETDERLRALAAVSESWAFDVLDLPEEANVGRFGFDRYPVTTEDFDDLLDRIVEGLVSDAVAEG